MSPKSCYYYFVLIFILDLQQLSAQEKFYFYQPNKIGSESSFNPFRMMFNNGYGILSANTRNNDITAINYSTGLENSWDNITSPIEHIGIYGWGNFFREELIPTSYELKNAQWWPNYTNHLIGGGMLYRKTAEWYEFNGAPKPKLLAYINIMAMHLFNEVVENNSFKGTNIDPITDLLLFDQLGILLFNNERAARFFSAKLKMRDWSLQPSLNFANGELDNAAQNYVIFVPYPGSNKTSLFYYWGNNGIVGLSRELKNKDNLSLGFGLTLKDFVELSSTDGVRKVTTDLVWTAGGFYDRNGSLLTSLILSGTKRYRALLNIYPGILHFGKFSPGIFGALNKNNEASVGVSFSFLPVAISFSQ
ncbi:MAG: hypothetical protein IIC39_03505 [Candidatus Marinimicrobia bacterium]|nr:hypothetical protein [Candidatus Neomarinimicrobiota bacterium]